MGQSHSRYSWFADYEPEGCPDASFADVRLKRQPQDDRP